MRSIIRCRLLRRAGVPGQAMNWLDALDPDDPDVVSLSGALAEMLVVATGGETEPHWNDTVVLPFGRVIRKLGDRRVIQSATIWP